MDFEQYQNEIKNAVQTNLGIKLQELNLADFDRYVDDYVDLDKYTNAKTLFFDFVGYNFEDLSNESNVEDFEFSVYMAFRKDTQSNLKKNMLKYSSAFYQMFGETGNNLGGVSDYGIITQVQFYDTAEGNPDIKVAHLTVHLFSERE